MDEVHKLFFNPLAHLTFKTESLPLSGKFDGIISFFYTN